MHPRCSPKYVAVVVFVSALWFLRVSAEAHLTDLTQTPNAEDAGIHKSLAEQIGAGRGDELTPDSSLFLIQRDPFRAIRRGRQLFQRKFTVAQGFGPRLGDGVGNIEATPAIGHGLMDSCAGCHANPRGAAGAGGAVIFTRPDHRDAPHVFGAGLKEMLADEMTAELRARRARTIRQAQQSGQAVTVTLHSKGIAYGRLTALPDGSVDTSEVEGVNPDLRVRPFFADGRRFSLRELTVAALRDAMGLEAQDPDLAMAAAGNRVVTPAGLALDGGLDQIQPPPAGANEIPVSLIDFFEFYLLNYFTPAVYEQTP